jgi:hypothetical protein
LAITAITAAYKDTRAELDRLIGERAKLVVRPVADNAETLTQEGIDQVDAMLAQECGKRGPECRKLEAISRSKREDLSAIITARAANRTVADLDAKIDAARRALSLVDIGAANRDADPQSVALARLTGQSEDGARTALHALIAVLLELGSGMGLYVVFGARRTEEDGATMPVLDPPAPIADSPATPENLHDGPIDRFVAGCMKAFEGGRVAGADLYHSYTDWCRATDSKGDGDGVRPNRAMEQGEDRWPSLLSGRGPSPLIMGHADFEQIAHQVLALDSIEPKVEITGWISLLPARDLHLDLPMDRLKWQFGVEIDPQGRGPSAWNLSTPGSPARWC